MKSIIRGIKDDVGQSLIEIVVALGLLAIVFTGSWQVLHDSFMSISQEITSLKAHYLIVEGLEGIRSMRDENWNVLVDGTKHFEYDESDPLNKVLILSDGEETVLGFYRRRLEISSVSRDPDTGKIIPYDPLFIDNDTKQVEVIVQWDYKGIERTDMERIYLTNWERT